MKYPTFLILIDGISLLAWMLIRSICPRKLPGCARTGLLSEDKGISHIIGVLLLLALTVVMTGIMIAYFMSFSNSIQPVQYFR